MKTTVVFAFLFCLIMVIPVIWIIFQMIFDYENSLFRKWELIFIHDIDIHSRNN
jgi:hypothetical protein